MSDRRAAGYSRVTPARRVGDVKPLRMNTFHDDEQSELEVLDPRSLDAYERGLQAGIEQGRKTATEQARAEIEAQMQESARAAGGLAAERLENLIAGFQAQFSQMEDQLADKTMELGVQIAQVIVAREIQTDAGILLPVVRQCIESLGDAAREVRITVNPVDLETIKSSVAAGDLQISDVVSEDSSIEPGGCRLESPTLLIDAELQTRWRRLLLSMGKESLVSADSNVVDSQIATGEHADRWRALIDNATELVLAAQPVARQGKLTRATGMVVEASGLKLPVGSICQIGSNDSDASVEAEVVGFIDGQVLLMPCSSMEGLSPGALVSAVEPAVSAPGLDQPSHAKRRSTDRSRQLPIGAGLLGRVVNGSGEPIDGFGDLTMTTPMPIRGRPIGAMQRAPVRTPLDTGIRAINTMLTVGRGQRLGLFAPAGVGKSVLMGMMAEHTAADVIVIGLIGERGREVREFVTDILGPSARQRSTVVAAPVDESPLMKIQAAVYATAIAEYYRDQGLHVLLVMDSLTRYAMSLREVALSVGEAPATRGYPSSVFARLPEIIERGGNGKDGTGSITAIYTVLVDADESNDPVGEAARSILDGHFVLSRDLAQAGHFPAIEISQSVSRVMTAVTDEAHQQDAMIVREAWSRYQNNRELILIGAYVSGSDPLLDRTIVHWEKVQAFLCQPLQGRISDKGQERQLLAELASLLRDGDVDSPGADGIAADDGGGE